MMFNNYFKIAVRNLRRNGTFSAINIFGLALGMACSMLIYLWVADERSIDNFHANGEQLFVVYKRQYGGGPVEANHNTAQLLAAELKRVVPEILRASGVAGVHKETFGFGDKVYKMEGSRAEPDFFTMFSYPLLQGTPQTALSSPTGLAISRRMAELFFGSTGAAVGKVLRYDNRKDLMVTAVFENFPPQASEKFDYLLHWDTWVKEDPILQGWESDFSRAIVQLRPGTDPGKVEAKISRFMDVHVKPTPTSRLELGLQRLGDRYLYSSFAEGKPSGGRIDYVRLFTGVALFMLLIACINFMNLATARSVKRAKEVGIRKVVGSNRQALVAQFIGEALLLAGLAAVVALVLVAVLLPGFNHLTEKHLTLPVANPGYWLALLGLVVITGFVAGSYPAFFLSSLQPIRVLKGTLRVSTGAVWFRKGLVIFQFALSIMLVISTMVVTRQTRYVQTKKLGYDRENLIYIPLEGDLVSKYLLFKQEASQLPGVKLVDRSSSNPHNMDFSGPFLEWEGKAPGAEINFAPASVGYDFVKLMGLKVVKGRDFSRAFTTDTTAFLINQLAAERMGFGGDPIGKWVDIFGKKGKVIGVLRNHHSQSLHQPIQPLVLDVKENLEFGTILVRTEAGRTREAVAGLERVSRKLNPNYPFAFSFSDEEYQKLYKSEQIVTTLSNAFALLAVLISCLGLLGLAMFSAEQRTREVGIRKVLGASEASIVTLFSKEFLKLVGISFVIAAPLAGLAMHRWLQSFAYRTELTWWIFAAGGALALLVALLTVSLQAVKAASTNPVRTLGAE